MELVKVLTSVGNYSAVLKGYDYSDIVIKTVYISL